MKSLLRLAISAILLTYIAWQTNWSRVGEAFRGMRVELWLAALGLLLSAQLVSAWRWKMFAAEMRFTRPYRQFVGFYLIGMYFNLMLPTSVGGDVVRAWYINGGSGRRMAALASVFLDRVNGLVVMVGLACLGVVLNPYGMASLPPWVAWTVWAVAGCGVLGLLALPLATASKWIGTGRRQQLQTLVQTMRRPKLQAAASVLSLVVQATGVCIVWLIARAINAPIPGGYFWILVPMVSLFAMLPSIGGMGVREGGMVLFLAPVGVDQDTALTLSFLWFAVSTTGSLLGGLVYMFGRFPKPAATPAADNEVTCGPIGSDSDQGRTGQSSQAA